jgi:hypothetical protein
MIALTVSPLFMQPAMAADELEKTSNGLKIRARAEVPTTLKMAGGQRPFTAAEIQKNQKKSVQVITEPRMADMHGQVKALRGAGKHEQADKIGNRYAN